MVKPVLVTYASKYGSTVGIADKIASVLSVASLMTEVMPVERAGDPSKYGAIVLGSGVY